MRFNIRDNGLKGKNMEELLAKKEELSREIKYAEGEMQMGQLTEDLGMAQQAETKKKELEELLKEVEEKLQYMVKIKEEELRREEIRQEIAKKLSSEYEFYRILHMSVEEAEELAASRPNPALEEKKALEEQEKVLISQREEAAERLNQIDARITEIKALFMENHDFSLIQESSNLMDERKELVARIDGITQNLEEIRAKKSQIEVQQISPVDIKQELIDQIEGNYSNRAEGPAWSYLREQQQKGKSPEEIVQELNEMQPKVEKGKKLDAYRDSEEFTKLSRVGTFGRNGHLIRFYDFGSNEDEMNRTLSLVQNVMNIPNIDTALRDRCVDIARLLDRLNVLNINYEDIKQKLEIRKNEVEAEDGFFLFDDKYKKLSDEEDRIWEEIRQIYRNLNNQIELVAISLANRMNEGYRNATGQNFKGLPIDQESYIQLLTDSENANRDVEQERKNFRSHWPAYITGESKKADQQVLVIEQKQQEADRLKSQRDEIRSNLDMNLTELVWEITGYSRKTVGVPTEIQALEEDLTEMLDVEPGKYTVEDIERYIIEKEFIISERKRAVADAEKVRDEIIAKRMAEKRAKQEEPELLDMRSQDELAQMMEEREQMDGPQAQIDTGYTKQ